MLKTRRPLLLFVLVGAAGLPLAFLFAEPLDFWILACLYGMTALCAGVVAVRHRSNTAEFGPPMAFDEIVRQQDPVRMVRLLRYHLGWSPGKIAAELNRQGIRNHGLPWRLHDVEQALKGVRRIL